jgi:alcohol dehydrogenase (NADP+)
MPETQQMLDHCGEKIVTADIEVIPIQTVSDTFERPLKRDLEYRFVIDLSSLKSPR